MKITGKFLGILLLGLLFINTNTSIFAQVKKEKDKREEGKNVTEDKKMMCSMDGEKGCCTGIKGLTDDQKLKMEKMETSHQKELLQLRNQKCEKESHLKTLEFSDNADLGAINKTIDEIGALKVDMMKKCAAHKQEVRKILTDEQRLQFDLKADKPGMREGMNKPQMHHNHDGDK